MVDMETATYRDRFASDGSSVKVTLGPVGRAHTSSAEGDVETIEAQQALTFGGKVTLDGRRHGRYDSFEGCLVTAARLVPKHRRELGAGWIF